MTDEYKFEPGDVVTDGYWYVHIILNKYKNDQYYMHMVCIHDTDSSLDMLGCYDDNLARNITIEITYD